MEFVEERTAAVGLNAHTLRGYGVVSVIRHVARRVCYNPARQKFRIRVTTGSYFV